MRQSDFDLGLVVVPHTLSMRLRIVVHLSFKLVIRAYNKPTPAPRNRNIAGQEVSEPCLQRVLVRMNEDCHRDDSAVFGWCRGKGPHPRSIDAAIVDWRIYGRECRLPNGIYRHNFPRRASIQ